MIQNSFYTSPALQAAPAEPVRMFTDENPGISLLKKGIWLYFVLLVIEGGLRKWILPGLAAPLLIVRDPVAIWLMWLGFKENIFRSNAYINTAVLLTLLSLITTLVFGHGNLTVAVYGARILLVQFPLLFLIGRVMDYEDVVKMGKAVLWMTPLMTVLIAVQFYSPQSAWVNRGVGGDINGGGFAGAMGFFRPPGTFSFTLGLTSFYGLVSAFVFFFWLDGNNYVKKWLLTLSTACLLAAVPLSISRTLMFEVLLSLLFTTAAALLLPDYLPRVLFSLLGLSVVMSLVISLGVVDTALEAFYARLDTASEIEGGVEGTLGDRFLGGMVAAITDSDQDSFWGKGLGMGTNAGAQLLTGKSLFLISEGEWGRLIGEMGAILGMTAILLRCMLIFKLSLAAWRQMRAENFLPWLLLSFAFVNILQGQWAQPTAQGFAILSGGLLLAALKNGSGSPSDPDQGLF